MNGNNSCSYRCDALFGYDMRGFSRVGFLVEPLIRFHLNFGCFYGQFQLELKLDSHWRGL